MKIPNLWPTRLSDSMLVVAAILLTATNLVVLNQNATLRATIEQMQEAQFQMLEVPVGRQLPPLEGLDIHDRSQGLLYDGESVLTIVMSFSPACGYCDENWPNWQRLMVLIDEVGTQSVRPVFVDLTGSADEEYLITHQLKDRLVILSPDPKTVVEYSLSITPQTIVVDGHGTVLGVWSGVLEPPELRAIIDIIRREKA